MPLRLSTEEISQRGEALYQRLRPRVEAENKGRLLALDVESGDFEIGEDHQVLARDLHARHPNALVYATRIGFPAVGRIGSRAVRRAE